MPPSLLPSSISIIHRGTNSLEAILPSPPPPTQHLKTRRMFRKFPSVVQGLNNLGLPFAINVEPKDNESQRAIKLLGRVEVLIQRYYWERGDPVEFADPRKPDEYWQHLKEDQASFETPDQKVKVENSNDEKIWNVSLWSGRMKVRRLEILAERYLQPTSGSSKKKEHVDQLKQINEQLDIFEKSLRHEEHRLAVVEDLRATYLPGRRWMFPYWSNMSRLLAACVQRWPDLERTEKSKASHPFANASLAYTFQTAKDYISQCLKIRDKLAEAMEAFVKAGTGHSHGHHDQVNRWETSTDEQFWAKLMAEFPIDPKAYPAFRNFQVRQLLHLLPAEFDVVKKDATKLSKRLIHFSWRPEGEVSTDMNKTLQACKDFISVTNMMYDSLRLKANRTHLYPQSNQSSGTGSIEHSLPSFSLRQRKHYGKRVLDRCFQKSLDNLHPDELVPAIR
ncbi:hypothetical protein T439DRAFT_356813 [Meredithblackwellia eburnea MCA 4105]